MCFMQLYLVIFKTIFIKLYNSKTCDGGTSADCLTCDSGYNRTIDGT